MLSVVLDARKIWKNTRSLTSQLKDIENDKKLKISNAEKDNLKDEEKLALTSATNLTYEKKRALIIINYIAKILKIVSNKFILDVLTSSNTILWLLGEISDDAKVFIKYINTKYLSDLTELVFRLKLSPDCMKSHIDNIKKSLLEYNKLDASPTEQPTHTSDEQLKNYNLFIVLISLRELSAFISECKIEYKTINSMLDILDNYCQSLLKLEIEQPKHEQSLIEYLGDKNHFKNLENDEKKIEKHRSKIRQEVTQIAQHEKIMRAIFAVSKVVSASKELIKLLECSNVPFIKCKELLQTITSLLVEEIKNLSNGGLKAKEDTVIQSVISKVSKAILNFITDIEIDSNVINTLFTGIDTWCTGVLAIDASKKYIEQYKLSINTCKTTIETLENAQKTATANKIKQERTIQQYEDNIKQRGNELETLKKYLKTYKKRTDRGAFKARTPEEKIEIDRQNKAINAKKNDINAENKKLKMANNELKNELDPECCRIKQNILYYEGKKSALENKLKDCEKPTEWKQSIEYLKNYTIIIKELFALLKEKSDISVDDIKNILKAVSESLKPRGEPAAIDWNEFINAVQEELEKLNIDSETIAKMSTIFAKSVDDHLTLKSELSKHDVGLEDKNKNNNTKPIFFTELITSLNAIFENIKQKNGAQNIGTESLEAKGLKGNDAEVKKFEGLIPENSKEDKDPVGNKEPVVSPVADHSHTDGKSNSLAQEDGSLKIDVTQKDLAVQNPDGQKQFMSSTTEKYSVTPNTVGGLVVEEKGGEPVTEPSQAKSLINGGSDGRKNSTELAGPIDKQLTISKFSAIPNTTISSATPNKHTTVKVVCATVSLYIATGLIGLCIYYRANNIACYALIATTAACFVIGALSVVSLFRDKSDKKELSGAMNALTEGQDRSSNIAH